MNTPRFKDQHELPSLSRQSSSTKLATIIDSEPSAQSSTSGSSIRKRKDGPPSASPPSTNLSMPPIRKRRSFERARAKSVGVEGPLFQVGDETAEDNLRTLSRSRESHDMLSSLGTVEEH